LGIEQTGAERYTTLARGAFIDVKKPILLVEPQRCYKYHTTYPPLGLLKIAAYKKKRGESVLLVQGNHYDGPEPKEVLITSLFTYAYEPVHEAIDYYKKNYKRTKIRVGGIYATLCKQHLIDKYGDRISVYEGLLKKAESCLPEYSLVPEWKTSILFSTRGCIRKCSFCSVPQIEPEFIARKSIRGLVYPGHEKVVFWDNNFLASPYIKDILGELEELGLEVDFNQGLDARLLNEDIALRLRKLKMPFARLAYDSRGVRQYVERSIRLLREAGFRSRKIIVYCLYNHKDTPEDFLERIRDLMEWDVVAYPMRYEPLEPRPKNSYVAPSWTAAQLEMVAKARRVIGYGGAFPPYDGLKKKIINARSFEAAFSLRSRDR